jgi:osmotically-inducible protein OsmY
MRLFGIGAALGVAVGGLFAFIFDPASGRRRRHTAADRTAAKLRRGRRRTARAGRFVGAEAYGRTQRLIHLRETPKDFDDVTLARKVETEIFRDDDVPKGQIVVNAQEGVVQLRGEVPDLQMLEAIVAKAADVQGVRDVENLLHLPGVPASMHQ